MWQTAARRAAAPAQQLCALTGSIPGGTLQVQVVVMRKKANGVAKLLRRVVANPRYRGKHLVVVAGKVFVARSAADAPRLFDRVTRTHRHATPTLLYIPKADALILWLGR